MPLMIDNTFATPYLCRPIDYGADIVVHSVTKFMGGHGTCIGGIIVDSGKFPLGEGQLSRCSTSPAPGLSRHEVSARCSGRWRYIIKCRVEGLRDFGPCISPFNSFLFLQGIETLGMRMDRHVATRWRWRSSSRSIRLVDWVKYPCSAVEPVSSRSPRSTCPRARARCSRSASRAATRRAGSSSTTCKMFSHLANVGDARSLVIHPASTTHQQLSADQQRAAGVEPEMVRLSVGLEDLDDIIWDLDQALTATR